MYENTTRIVLKRKFNRYVDYFKLKDRVDKKILNIIQYLN